MSKTTKIRLGHPYPDPQRAGGVLRIGCVGRFLSDEELKAASLGAEIEGMVWRDLPPRQQPQPDSDGEHDA